MSDKTEGESKEIQKWQAPQLPQRDPMAEWDLMIKQADVLLKSHFLPEAITTAEQAVAVIQAGRELGLGMMQSLRTIHIIKRRVCLSSELMEGLVYQRVPGASILITKTTPEICTIVASRPNVEPTEFSFSLKDADRAGLLSKGGTWQTYPQIMLQWRCMSRVCKAVFGDAVMGLYTPEEMGADVNAEGQVIVLPPEEDDAISMDGGVEESSTSHGTELTSEGTACVRSPAEPQRELGGTEPGEFTRDDEEPPPSDEDASPERPPDRTEPTQKQVKFFLQLEAELHEKLGAEAAVEMLAAIQKKCGLLVTCAPQNAYNRKQLSTLIDGLIKAAGRKT